MATWLLRNEQCTNKNELNKKCINDRRLLLCSILVGNYTEIDEFLARLLQRGCLLSHTFLPRHILHYQKSQLFTSCPFMPF